VNKIILIGHLGKDPENKTTPTGKSVTKFSMATNDYGTTSWHYIEAWDKTADLAAQYLRKGSMVAVEGRVKYSVVEKDGKKTTYTSVVADRLEFVGRPHEDGKTKTTGLIGGKGDYTALTNEDIPF
jgi:single-strand DNA-binding protein